MVKTIRVRCSFCHGVVEEYFKLTGKIVPEVTFYICTGCFLRLKRAAKALKEAEELAWEHIKGKL